MMYLISYFVIGMIFAVCNELALKDSVELLSEKVLHFMLCFLMWPYFAIYFSIFFLKQLRPWRIF